MWNYWLVPLWRWSESAAVKAAVVSRHFETADTSKKNKKKQKKVGSILDKQQFSIHGDVQWRFLEVKRA